MFNLTLFPYQKTGQAEQNIILGKILEGVRIMGYG